MRITIKISSCDIWQVFFLARNEKRDLGHLGIRMKYVTLKQNGASKYVKWRKSTSFQKMSLRFPDVSQIPRCLPDSQVSLRFPGVSHSQVSLRFPGVSQIPRCLSDSQVSLVYSPKVPQVSLRFPGVSQIPRCLSFPGVSQIPRCLSDSQVFLRFPGVSFVLASLQGRKPK